MNSDGRSTSQQLYIPTLLVIGAGEDLVERCQDAADATGLGVKTCTLAHAPAAIPRRHPLAIVVPNRVFAAAADDLTALARDVRSVLFPVDAEVTVRELEAMFAAAIAACSTQRERRRGAGRYSITDGVVEEAPFSRRPGDRVSNLPSPPSTRSVAPRPGPVSTRPSLTARQMLPRVAPDDVPTYKPPPPAAGESSGGSAAPDYPSRFPPQAPLPRNTDPELDLPSRLTEPPCSGTQAVDRASVERPSYAALRAVFSSR